MRRKIEKILIIALAPLCAIILVLAWFYLIQKDKNVTKLTLAGLGITIALESVNKSETSLEITNHEGIE